MTTRSYLDSSTWETLGVTQDGQRPIMRNPATGLACCYDLDGTLVSPEVYEHNRQERIRDAAPAMLAALQEAEPHIRGLGSAHALAAVHAAIRAAKEG